MLRGIGPARWPSARGAVVLFCALILFLARGPSARAGDPLEARAATYDGVTPQPAGPETGLSGLALFDLKTTATDITTSNPLLNGQVVGALGGTNTTEVGNQVATYTEQRVTALGRWTPRALDGKLALGAAVEVDFGWGDQSYGSGGNTGGAFGGDQVNLQTRRLNARLLLAEGLVAVAGLQFVADNAVDPEGARLDDLLREGGRLAFWGSEASGLSLYGRRGDLRARLGAYTLYELASGEPDDVTLWMADARVRLDYRGMTGLHAWYLRDRGGGDGTVLGAGPTSSLSAMQGGPRLDWRDSGEEPETSADLWWLGVDLGWNPVLDRGDLGFGALVVANLGRLYVAEEPDAAVRGGVVLGEGGWRWAPGAGSVLRALAVGSTADQEGDAAYSGAITGNSYGIAGAQPVGTGCLLLFPDLTAVNRQVAEVYDVSGGGEGLLGGSLSAGWDGVPNRLTLGLGGGWARMGEVVARELNARLVGVPLPLAKLGLHGAVLESTARDRLAWATYAAFQGVLF